MKVWSDWLEAGEKWRKENDIDAARKIFVLPMDYVKGDRKCAACAITCAILADGVPMSTIQECFGNQWLPYQEYITEKVFDGSSTLDGEFEVNGYISYRVLKSVEDLMDWTVMLFDKREWPIERIIAEARKVGL